MSLPLQRTGDTANPGHEDLRTSAYGLKATSRIPSLDGLRAVSIFLVLALHTLQRYSLNHPVASIWGGIFDGGTGVLIFFVISGYLITTLLLKEHQRRGSISLRGFYFRRAMRILPPLYLYVGVLLLLGLAGRIALYKVDVVSALFFFHDYAGGRMWTLEHFWSLSIEEQFYLIWPFVLIYCLRRHREDGRRRAGRVALTVVFLSPVIRVLSFLHSPHVPGFLHEGYGLHIHADSLMFGCLVALYQETPAFERLYRAATRIWWIPPAVILVSDCINSSVGNYWQLPFGFTVCGASAAVFLLWCVRNPGTIVGRMLNARPIVHVGVLSYSIYLWQTLFLHSGNITIFGSAEAYVGRFPGNWLAVMAAASLSFYLVEKPSLRLRNRLIASFHFNARARQAAGAARIPAG